MLTLSYMNYVTKLRSRGRSICFKNRCRFVVPVHDSIPTEYKIKISSVFFGPPKAKIDIFCIILKGCEYHGYLSIYSI